jgi:hypothetical protein
VFGSVRHGVAGEVRSGMASQGSVGFDGFGKVRQARHGLARLGLVRLVLVRCGVSWYGRFGVFRQGAARLRLAR